MRLKVLIAVTHLLGIGHLTRAAAIARAFAQAGHETILVSGGTAPPLVVTNGVSVVQLPPVRIAGTAFTTLLDEHHRPIDGHRLRDRRAALLETLENFRPHVVVAELFPFGRRVLAEEFLAVFEAARKQSPRPLILSSVRDILAAPKVSRVEETHRRVRTYCDAVLVHGDPDLVPLDRSWPLAGQIGDLIRYTGYVDEGADRTDADAGASPGARHDIVVSGGGSAASLPLYRAVLGAAAARPARHWLILVGHGIPDAAFESLRGDTPPNTQIERARGDFRAVLRGAALSISQAGYNTVVDLLRAGTRSILVPFEAGHETEQRLRADHLASRGLAHVLLEARLSADTLAACVDHASLAPAPAAAVLNLDGAGRTVEIVERLARREAPAVSPRHVDRSVWRPLDEALRRAVDQGRTVRVWWRDDDATAQTPALDRLLALTRRFAVPLAIAAVPAQARPSLRERLEGEAVAILVHGLAHANHAPPGVKKAELGPHHRIADRRAKVAEALAQARAKLGPSVLPVLVPPWNRIAPDLVGALPDIGYCGLSTFGHRSRPEPARGLRQVNAHIDPIDWRGSRGLVEPVGLAAHVAGLIAAQGTGLAEPDEPLGLLTHHLVQDEAVWAFCEALVERLAASAAVRFVAMPDLLSATVPQNRDHVRS